MSEIIVTTKEELKQLISDSVRIEINRLMPFSGNEPATISNNPEPLKIYTRKEVAKIFQVSLTTLDGYIHDGKIEATRFGTRVRFSREAIDDAMKRITPAKKIA